MELINKEKEIKRGRRPKNQRREYIVNREQTKFFVDLGQDNTILEKIFRLLESVNNKESGKEITFKDLAIYGLNKINSKDIEKIKESSLSEMEKVELALKEFNMKNELNLTLGEFLVKKLNIN